ncbi:MAG: hypothetical protein DRJ34_01545 [Thermoprotei archaeon]|nr:MAG: hypothetical protein DRJ34_01545 [Thermoprotei archaeon]
MKDYKYIRGVGFVRKTDYYLYLFAAYFFLFVILVSTFATTLVIAFALFEILKSYFVYPIVQISYALSLIYVLGACLMVGNYLADCWIEATKQNLRRRYHKEGV